jgi:uncharacterized protein (DUF1501 family)
VNSTAGTDHGWGGDHFVMSGAVRGRRAYGTFPSLALGGPDDARGHGLLLPTTSLDQYGATLAQWFGVSAANLPQVFPNLGRFSTPNLGFMV